MTTESWTDQEVHALQDENARLREALEKIVEADRWNNLPYTGVNKWNYGPCAAIALMALDGELP